LWGRSAEKLERVLAVCQEMVREAQPPMVIAATTDLREALIGADYVLNQVRVGGLEARAHDETFPQALGMPGEETVGPGGFANALRTVPVVLDLLRVASEVAPQALILNLTNPASIVQHAAARFLGARMLSLCDSPLTLIEEVAASVDLPRASLDVGYLGMNHLGWILSLRAGEHDVLPQALANLERLPRLGVDANYVRASGAIPSPYVRYFFHPERILAQQKNQIPRARQLQALESELLEAYGRFGSRPSGNQAPQIGRRGAIWYKTIIVPVLDALVNQRKSVWVVNTVNNGLIPWLPAETVLEVPARLSADGIYPLPVADHLLPGELRVLLLAQAEYELLAAQAIVAHDRQLALRALVANPLVRSLDRAEHVLAALWRDGKQPDDAG
jgi:6-phospho-beta-glucosidase